MRGDDFLAIITIVANDRRIILLELFPWERHYGWLIFNLEDMLINCLPFKYHMNLCRSLRSFLRYCFIAVKVKILGHLLKICFTGGSGFYRFIAFSTRFRIHIHFTSPRRFLLYITLYLETRTRYGSNTVFWRRFLIPLDKRRCSEYRREAGQEELNARRERECTFRSRRTVVVDLSHRINRKHARLSQVQKAVELFSRNPQRGLGPYPVDPLSHTHCASRADNLLGLFPLGVFPVELLIPTTGLTFDPAGLQLTSNPLKPA